METSLYIELHAIWLMNATILDVEHTTRIARVKPGQHLQSPKMHTLADGTKVGLMR